MRADHLYLWSLILSFYSPFVDSVRTDPTGIPQTYWLDVTCLERDFTLDDVSESLGLAANGAARLMNENDLYQAFIYQKLFGRARDTRVITGDLNSETWSVIEIEAWIGSMKYERIRDNADVRIYCDEGRWTLVPDDEASVIEGLPVNSQRTFGISQEYEDKKNYMRRDPTNKGCDQEQTLGVTYTTPIPFDPNSRGIRVPQNYHSFRQTITICDVSFSAQFMRLRDLEVADWENLEMFTLEEAPTVILLYQLLTLNNFRLYRDVDPAAFENTEDSWAAAIQRPPTGLGFVHKPGPYLWNAIFAFLASLGWSLQQGLSQETYESGVGLLQYNAGLVQLPYRRPPILPASLNVPQWLLTRIRP